MTKDQMRIHELEAFNSSLMRERVLRSKNERLEEEAESRRTQVEDLKSSLSHVRAMLNSETKLGETLYGQLVEAKRQRDSFRQELMDLHDYIMSGGDHECDMGPDCPVMECLRMNP